MKAGDGKAGAVPSPAAPEATVRSQASPHVRHCAGALVFSKFSAAPAKPLKHATKKEAGDNDLSCAEQMPSVAKKRPEARKGIFVFRMMKTC